MGLTPRIFIWNKHVRDTVWNCSAELLNLKRRERITKTFLELIERIVLIILRLDGHIGVSEVDPCLLEYLVGFWWPILLEISCKAYCRSWNLPRRVLVTVYLELSWNRTFSPWTCDNYYCFASCPNFPRNIIENSHEVKTNDTLSEKSPHELKINPTYSLDSLLEGFGIIKPFYCWQECSWSNWPLYTRTWP